MDNANVWIPGLMGMLLNGTMLNTDRCAGGSDFSALILHVSPYLYPFSIEYSILVGTCGHGRLIQRASYILLVSFSHSFFVLLCAVPVMNGSGGKMHYRTRLLPSLLATLSQIEKEERPPLHTV